MTKKKGSPHKKIIPLLELDQYIDKIKQDKKSVVLVGGCFDILHRGHIEFLQSASELADVLIVQLESDKNVKIRKGKDRPIHSQEDRARMLAGIDGVDLVLLLPDFEDDSKYFELVKQIRPDIIGITEGDPTHFVVPQAKFVGARVEALPRLDGYSTTGIIEKARKR